MSFDELDLDAVNVNMPRLPLSQDGPVAVHLCLADRVVRFVRRLPDSSMRMGARDGNSDSVLRTSCQHTIAQHRVRHHHEAPRPWAARLAAGETRRKRRHLIDTDASTAFERRALHASEWRRVHVGVCERRGGGDAPQEAATRVAADPQRQRGGCLSSVSVAP